MVLSNVKTYRKTKWFKDSKHFKEEGECGVGSVIRRKCERPVSTPFVEGGVTADT